MCRASKYWVMIIAAAILLVATEPVMAQGGGATDGYNAEIIEQRYDFEISGPGKARLDFYSRIKINNPSGEKYGRVSVHESRFNTIKDLEILVLDEQGNEVKKLKKDDGYKMCGADDISLYIDLCQWSFGPTHHSYPYYIECRYRYEFKSLWFWPDWDIDRRIPVKLSEYNLEVPADFQFHYKTYNDAPPPEVQEEGNRRIYKFRLEDAAPRHYERCEALYINNFSEALFAADRIKLDNWDVDGHDWKALGRFYYEMCRSCRQLDPAQKELVDGLKAANGNDTLQFINRLYDSLAQKTRYVSVSVGVGWWQPSKSCDIYKRGWGDCKDLSLLMSSMLEYAGIPTSMCLLRTRPAGMIDPDFPTLGGFNHCILFALVGGDTLWMDPTCDFCPPGQLPDMDEIAFALATGENGGRVVRVPASLPDENIISRKANLILEGDLRNLPATIDYIVSGNVYQVVCGSRDYDIELEQIISQYPLFRLGDSFKLDSALYVDDDSERAGATHIRVFGSVLNSVNQVGENIYLNMDFLDFFSECEKKFTGQGLRSLNLGYPRTYLDTIRVDFNGSMYKYDSVTSNFEDGFGNCCCSTGMEGTHFVVTRKRECNGYYIGQQEFIDYKEHLEGLRQNYIGRVKLQKM